MKFASTSVSLLLVLTLAAGCQSTGPESQGQQGQSGQAAAQKSGFLGDYSQLKAAPDREGVMLYIDHSQDYRPFTKLLFEPVQVLAEPGPDQIQMPPDALKRMRSQFEDSFRRALEPAYQVVTTPGPDVLRVRAAITGLQPAKPKAGAVDYLPVKALFNVGREAAGGGPRVAEMTAEMEVLDPQGKRVMAATATRKGDKTLPQGEQVTWDKLQSISDYWAQGFRARLDQLRSGTATSSR